MTLTCGDSWGVHHTYCHEAAELTDNQAKGYSVFSTGMPGTQASITIIICSCSMLSSELRKEEKNIALFILRINCFSARINCLSVPFEIASSASQCRPRLTSRCSSRVFQ